MVHERRTDVVESSARRERIELILQQIDRLPTLPQVAARLLAVTTSEESCLKDVVEIASADAALTAAILHLVRRADVGARQDHMDISKAIGSVYGPGAEQAFLPLWRKHIGFVVEYTQGVATQDKSKQEKAVADLVQYTQDLGAFLSSANPNLPKPVVADLVKTHVLTLKEVIDAQASGNAVQVYTALRRAASHMAMIADPLSDAIVKQFPAKYAI